jgi:hypothetical protein
MTSEEALMNEETLIEEESREPDLAEVINQLTGRWSYPGNWLSEIVIESGREPDQIVAMDLAEQHWREGMATVRVGSWDDLTRVQIDIVFDTGVSVGGVVSEDFTTIEWDNNTRWERS